MGLPSEIGRRIRMLFHREELYMDLEDEMRLHLDLRREQKIERGMSPAAASQAAHLKFGNTTLIKEKSMMVWGSEKLESFFKDLAYGIRGLLRSPSLTAVALISLALGIGANTAIFTLLDAVLLRSLPVRDPKQLVLLGTGDASGIANGIVNTELFSYPFYRQLQQRNSVFSDVAAINSMTNDVHGFVVNSSGASATDSQLMHVNLVSGTYFGLLGVQAQMGRMLTDADDSSEGDHPVVVLSQGFWKRAMAEDANVLGRGIKLGDTIFTVVGIAPAEFFGTKVGESPDMWVPLSMAKSVPPGWDSYHSNFTQFVNVIGRLKPGVSIAAATTNVNLLLQQISRGFPDADLSQKNLAHLSESHVPLTPMANGLSSLRQEFSKPLQVLLAIAALVLLIACANIANLLLARSTARARELAVRQALGARRGRLIRQLLTESLTLALTGGLLGVGFAFVASKFLLHMVSGGAESIPLDIGLNLRLLAFTFTIALSTAVLFGTIPALLATRLNLTGSLKEGRSPGGMGAKNNFAKALVISQVALSLVLTVGAALFLRSLANLNHVDTGFSHENVLRLQVETDVLGYKEDDPRLNALFQQIETRVTALPGVKAASFSAFTFHEGSWSGAVLVPGMPNNENVAVHQNVVGNGYFDTMKIPLIAGRTFTSADTATSQHVAVISEHIAKTLLPPGNPLGRHIRIGRDLPEREYEIIGIVKDVKFNSLQEEQENINYLSYAQRPWNFGDFEVRYAGDFANISNSVQQAIKEVDHNVRISHVTTLDEQIERSVTNQRLVAQLSSFFGLLAVFLSAIGIYGLMSYVVSRRTNEIGVRMALGAARSNISWLVMREILIMLGIGAAIGAPAVFAGGRLVATMLYGLNGVDLVSLAVALFILAITGSIAGYFPAKNAAKIDPIRALRYE